MFGAIATPYSILSPVISECEFKPKLLTFVEKNPSHLFYKIHSTSLSISSTFPLHVTLIKDFRFRNRFIPKASSVQSAEYIEEPATKVKFQKSLVLPGCSDSLTLLGTGYREKIFAIISVKVYAAGLYANQSIIGKLNSWKGKSSSEILQDSSLFNSIYQDSLEKSLQIVLVRDVDGKTFWNALDEAISPRIKAPTPVDESSLSTFRSVFQARSLKKGNVIFLTWLAPSKMLVSISSDGLPFTVEATIESMNVTTALFNVFFGDTPVSPSLKASIAEGLELVLK